MIINLIEMFLWPWYNPSWIHRWFCNKVWIRLDVNFSSTLTLLMCSASLRLVWVTLRWVQSDGCWSMSSVSVSRVATGGVGFCWVGVDGVWVLSVGMATCGPNQCGMRRALKECGGDGGRALPACWLGSDAAHGGAVGVRRQHVGLPLFHRVACQ